MQKKTVLDLQKVEAALKRAAKVAASGTREQRAGRLSPAVAKKSSVDAALAQRKSK